MNQALMEFIFQITATLILIFILYKWAWPGFKESVEKRREEINSNIDEAHQKNQDATILKEKYNEELGNIREEKIEILNNSVKEAKIEKQQIIDEAKTHGKEIIKKSMEEAELERKTMEEALQKSALEYVNDVAGKFISKTISDEEEMALFEKAIEKAE